MIEDKNKSKRDNSSEREEDRENYMSNDINNEYDHIEIKRSHYNNALLIVLLHEAEENE